MRKRFLSALLALCMALTLFPATALAGNYGKEQLEGEDLAMYIALREHIAEIASGKKTSTVYEKKFTLTSTTKEGVDAEAGAISARAQNAINYLLVDCPAELYWYEKTVGYTVGGSISMETSNGSITKATYDFGIKFAVSKDYADNYQTPAKVETALGVVELKNTTLASAETAPYTSVRANAQAIVDQNKNVSDFEKLTKYKEAICGLVSYNKEAAEDDTTPYGDPWQLIYVFDNDPDTNVVCEGYSKAFQYLCDLTTFADSSIVCYTVTGNMSGGTGEGGHMWNIVQIGGKNYLVDVTNSDEGSVGQGGELFMAGKAAEADGSYKFAVKNQTITFTYDKSQQGFYGDTILKLDTRNYTPPVRTPVTITVPETALSVEIGKTNPIKAATDPAGLTLTYASSNDTVAAVDENGVVTGVAAGTATITVSYAGDATHEAAEDKTVAVTVTEPAAPDKTPVTITAPETLSVKVGETNSIKAATDPAGLTLTYASSNDTVAAVDENGVVTGVAAGTATITVSYAGDATHEAAADKTVTVTVEEPAAPDKTPVTITAPETLSVKVGEPKSINAASDPAGLTLNYESSDETVATVDENGVVTGVAAGTATITVKYAGDETHEAAEDKTVAVTVGEPAGPVEKTDWNFTVSANPSSIKVGEKAQITVSGVENTDITYTVNNEDLASITSSGELTALKAGTVTVIAVKAADAEHNETPETVEVVISEADVQRIKPVLTVEPKVLTVTVGTSVTTANFDTLTARDGNTEVEGVWAFVGTVDTTTTGDIEVTIKFTPSDSSKYEEAEKTVTVAVLPAEPAAPVVPTVRAENITVASDKIADVTNSSIKGTATANGVNVPGTWAFVDAVPDAVGTYTLNVRFTPADTAKYTAADTTLTLYITKPPVIDNSQIAGKLPGGVVIKTDNKYNPVDNRYELKLTINTNVTFTALFNSMFAHVAQNGTVHDARGNVVGTWDGAAKKFTPAPDFASQNVFNGTYVLTNDSSTGAFETQAIIVNQIDDDETYYISVANVTGGEIIPSTRYAAYGERVTLSVYADKGYKLDSLTVRDIRGRTLATRETGSDRHTFYMPSGRVEVNAVFVKTAGEAESSAPASDIPGTSHTTADPNNEPFTGLGTPGISGIVLNPASMPFSDVKGPDWYYNYVEYMWKHYLMSGTSDTRFDPNLTTSRAMIWTIMARMNNIRTDINPGSTWYERGMLWAMEQGVTDGTNPMGNITREQLVTMLWRNAGQPNAGGSISQFSDAGSVSGYAQTAVRWAVGAGILTGENGRINPQGTATRAQVAAMIARYGDKIA